MLIVPRAMLRWSIVLSLTTLISNASAEKKVTYDDLVQRTMTIVQSCAVSDPSDVLLLAGDYERFFERSLLEDLPVALISESRSTAPDHIILSRHSFEAFKQFAFLRVLHRLNRFVVVASSQSMLDLLLMTIRNSPWANPNGLHVLIDRETVENGCANAYRFLWTGWMYDMLRAIFVCIDPVEGLLIYTYNPYSSEAPSTWRHAGSFEGRGGHPWTLLKRKYQSGSRMCVDLMFDKTRNLNGYEIRLNAVAFTPYLDIHPTKKGWDQFSGDNWEILKIVFQKLNATLNVNVHNGTVYDLGGLDSEGNVVGMMGDVATGVVDMGMNARGLYAMWKVQYTYPHVTINLCAITQKTGEISEFIKILSFMSPLVFLGNVAILMVANCILAKYQGFLPALLNIFRLITSVSVHGLPNRSSIRIFFCMVFVLNLIMNALLDSNWASLITVPIPQSKIRTLEDLKNSNYKIHSSKYLLNIFHDPELRSRIQEETYDGCKQRVLESRYSACLGNCLHQTMRIQNDRLQRSKAIMRNRQVYVTRENWPLFKVVTKLIQATVEAGLVGMWRRQNTYGLYLRWRRKQVEKKRRFRILEVRHVSFCFYVLAIGHSCAILVFLTELIIKKTYNRRS
ncbi:uncharacterized protein LOC143429019 [Xylocopa sonorina]|uniref:uncharacterized protein LOC143429019 n=1 Tax=Xylocopa sonorina TaxID=1818115 RepID=UPI00403A9E74